ncbi:hypothetical protein HDV03_003260 [Kappamyces sp. JEL0829]|nr:hypothetical protein HDV03_003260 [Kappamyces sp. JEL0829]
MSDDDLQFKKPKKKMQNKRKVEQEETDGDHADTLVSASALKQAIKKGRKIEELTEQKGHVLGEDMSSLGVAFRSSGTASSLLANTATRVLDIDRGIAGDVVSADPSKVISGEQAEKLDNGFYQGQSGYKEFVNKKKEKVTQSNAGGLRAGPLKGLSTVRVSSRFDYAPAICKDYKETDYKMGWQLDKEWEEQQKRDMEENDPNRYFDEEVVNDAESDDDLPFACLICRKDFTNPIVTKCGHYFCEKCALKQFSKSPSCFACNQNTQGVFNVAKEFKVKLAEKRKRMEERAKQIAKEQAQEEQSD